MVPAVSDWIPRVPPYSGYCSTQPLVTCTRLSLSVARLSRRFQFLNQVLLQSYNPDDAVTSPVWASALSLAATQAIDVSFFSSSYLDVSVQRVCSRLRVTDLWPAGLSHSDIRGSILVCKSPRLFAAFHVLLRLQEPRHPPYALLLLYFYLL